MAVADHAGEIQHHPAVALPAVAVQLMVMGVQAGDAAEVDHGWTVTAGRLTA